MYQIKVAKILIFIILFSLISTVVFAGITGKITGRIIDQETGSPLIGANVMVKGTSIGAASDLNGDFMILNIPPGVYNIQVSMIGYQSQTINNVNVSVDLTTKISFSLSSVVLESGEEVIVIAERKMITVDMTGSQSVVGSEEIASLPVDEISDVVELQAGVVVGRDGAMHIRGGRSDEVSYMVDGISLSDVFSGDIAVEVENNSVQELQVISGTFNAEYGRAMSGIVNIVTKDGGDKIGGAVTLYCGDYISNDDDIYPHIDKISLTGVTNLQLSLDGPIPGTKKKLRFFSTLRFLNEDGYIFGTRTFNPEDESNFSADDPDQWIIEKTGDGKSVPMRPNNKITLHNKLSYRIAPTMKLTGSLMMNKMKNRDWRNEGKEVTPENQFHDFFHFMLNPDGASWQYQNGYTVMLSLDHTTSPRSFYTFNLTKSYNEQSSYVYEDPFDSRYLNPNSLQNISYGNAFFTGGVDPWHSHRSTGSYVAKFDITNQITKTHQIKAGAEYRKHELDFTEYKIIPAKDSSGIEIIPFQPAIPIRESPYHNRYTKSPGEFSFYVQDKMEFDYMIVNVGLRYDMFDPNAVVPGDLSDPGNQNKQKKAKIKNQFSPRLGIAYPISEKGVMHFSYGYFFQMPLFQYLYANSEFEVEIGRLKTLMGNADLNPQKTIIYEVGLQQQLSEDLAIDVTAYYKDTRDLLGTEIYQTLQGDRYARYENRDFGNTRGIVFALNKRQSKWLSTSLDYTFQIAEGNTSEPNSAFVDRQSNREPEKRLLPLDWDQRHTINGAITFSPTARTNISLLGRYGSGLPYTPKFLNIRRALTNTARSPMTMTFDLKTNYNFTLMGNNIVFFLKVFNLFDHRNEVFVYPDTGRSGYTLVSLYTGLVRGYNSIDDFFYCPPNHYSPPREMQLGITMEFGK